jgi:hypothetical protein
MKLLLFGDIEGTRPIQLLLLREPDGTSAASLGSYCGGPDLGPALFEIPSGAGNQRGSSSDQPPPRRRPGGLRPGQTRHTAAQSRLSRCRAGLHCQITIGNQV